MNRWQSIIREKEQKMVERQNQKENPYTNVKAKTIISPKINNLNLYCNTIEKQSIQVHQNPLQNKP